MRGCVLTGGLTDEDRSGTLIDWNLCFNAHGESSRGIRSGTPVFMAPILLDDEQVSRRTLGHDTESFFTVIIWIATLDYDDEAAFHAKPLANNLLDQNIAPKYIAHAKGSWFGPGTFRREIIDYFEPRYRQDIEFCKCLIKLRIILYPVGKDDLDDFDKNDNKGMGDEEDDDPMKEDLFRKCMKEIDDYLHETKGCFEMQLINSTVLARQTPESR